MENDFLEEHDSSMRAHQIPLRVKKENLEDKQKRLLDMIERHEHDMDLWNHEPPAHCKT